MTSKQSMGGKARAQALSSEARREIARTAAATRWAMERDGGELPKATHRGEVEIGDAKIPCAVLEDGKRVLSEFGITQALGSRSGASKRIKKAQSEQGGSVPVFLAPKVLNPFITTDLLEGPLKPIQYKAGRRVLIGYEAPALVKICNIWLEARDAGVLQPQQYYRAHKAELLIRALADVGIVALVDEATGFQEERAKNELHQLLEKYLSEERLAWAKRFPDEYYKQLYRLKGWGQPSGSSRTQYVGKLTNTIVYERLPQGVLEELRLRNPTQPKTGRRRFKHHQFFSEEIGQPDLRDHILQVVTLMKVSKDWREFESKLNALLPTKESQIEMDFNKTIDV